MEDYLQIRDNIRGGVAQTVFRFAEVGQMDVSSIKMLDVNSLYSWCMLQELPTDYLCTVSVLEHDKTDWFLEMQNKAEDETFLCTVDLEYPAELHDINAHFFISTCATSL
ncbi:unnamed protein product [Ceratitis capitata]|uniref:(Mediterranean fruit fly) hypothetical protein n=1 Tax=Ceratitis capitata TaxID=7213 RepID=W8CA37_CERCA|nr:unnamed protein product [Ceratitis capitata]